MIEMVSVEVATAFAIGGMSLGLGLGFVIGLWASIVKERAAAKFGINPPVCIFCWLHLFKKPGSHIHLEAWRCKYCTRECNLMTAPQAMTCVVKPLNKIEETFTMKFGSNPKAEE